MLSNTSQNQIIHERQSRSRQVNGKQYGGETLRVCRRRKPNLSRVPTAHTRRVSTTPLPRSLDMSNEGCP